MTQYTIVFRVSGELWISGIRADSEDEARDHAWEYLSIDIIDHESHHLDQSGLDIEIGSCFVDKPPSLAETRASDDRD